MDDVTDIELNQLIEGLKNRGFTFGMLTMLGNWLHDIRLQRGQEIASKQNYIRRIDTNS
jgi:hypothetical protein